MATMEQIFADRDAFTKLIAKQSGGFEIYPASMTVVDKLGVAMARKGVEKILVTAGQKAGETDAFDGEMIVTENLTLKLCPLSIANSKVLQGKLDFLQARPLGVKKSFGAGDRLGIATPGHVQAIRNGKMRPIFCQQSIREMTRTGRTPDEVMADACWGILQSGYRDGFGADADHLKNPEDIDRCFVSGFTFFTVDPGDYVDSSADSADAKMLAAKYEVLPWETLECSADQCRTTYADKSYKLDSPLGGFKLMISGEDLLRAAVKYGRAVAHVKMMYEHLQAKAGDKAVEFEVSVDETETPTSAAEHYYVASELRRLGVKWVSLAPRFVGDFEKGVDYIGDLEQFRSEFDKHVGLARHFGPYKISLHSGSDKFSIYPIAAELAGELVHLKTAGTSYLEALRAIAKVDPGLFREILAFAKERYPEDRATYHVSADVDKVARPGDLTDAQLPGVLDQFDTREACHVTFGSVLRNKKADGSFIFRERFFQTLRENEQVYYDILEKHIGKHIGPFS
ncbi:MAG: hypothetical protein JW936_01960 [Sedimentisphaerales bacterium]|nr:hypothetical protein [Sedimentisphaerales bacterium]